MSFVFRKFAKSRRKKTVGQPSHNAGAVVTGVARIDLSSSVSVTRVEGNVKRNGAQPLLVSQADDDDDDKTHPLNEQSPSHCSSSVSMTGAPHTPLHKTSCASDQYNNRNSNSGLTVSTPPDSTRRNRFNVMRRKSDSTPDTAASTPPSLSRSSRAAMPHKRGPIVTVQRGTQNRFSEIYSPTPQLKESRFSQQDQKPPETTTPDNHTTNSNREPIPESCLSSCSPRSEQCILPISRSLEAIPGAPVPHNVKPDLGRVTRRKAHPDNLNRNMGVGTTKTLIMNGDIVVCASHSNTTSDTGTTASTTSSKGRALRREAERIARAAGSLDTKGNELFEKGYFDKAMACYSKALKLKRRTFAHLLEEVDDMEEQLNMCDSEKADPQILVSMATSINNIGYLRQRSGDATPEETMAAYKKSLHIKRRILGNDSLSVGKTLNNIGSVHYLKREFELAIPAYEEALKIMKVTLGEKHTDVATVMSNIGDVFLAQGDPETSLRQYRQALTIRWESFGEKDPRVTRLLEKIAKVEIGDRMTLKTTKNEIQQPWDDDEASELLDSGLKPIAEEFQVLQQQVAKDIEYVSLMERRATVEMLKDRIVIIRGMRDVWEGNGPELLDNDTASVKTARSLSLAEDVVIS